MKAQRDNLLKKTQASEHLNKYVDPGLNPETVTFHHKY